MERPLIFETTALGAAYLAGGLTVGVWDSQADIAKGRRVQSVYEPKMDENQRAALYQQWKRAVRSVKSWVSHA